MISNKITFCLASLVVFLALAFGAPQVLAGDFGTELSVEDVSFADKSFPQYQYDTQVGFDRNTIVYVKFDKVVDYRGGRPQDLPPDENYDDFKDTGVFTHHDIVIDIYHVNGALFSTRTGAGSVVIEPRELNRHDGKNFRITFNTLIADPPGSQNFVAPPIEESNSVLVYIKQGAVTAADPGLAAADSMNAAASLRFNLVYGDGRNANPDGYEYPNSDTLNTESVFRPAVYEITPIDLIPFAGVTKPFQVKIRLSEQPRAFTADHIDVTEGTVTEVVGLKPVNPYHIFSPLFENDADIRYYPTTGRGLIGVGTVYYEYLVTIQPKFENKNDIIIKVKEFEDLVKPNRYAPFAPNKYEPPTSEVLYIEGFDKLTVKVGKEEAVDKKAGIRVTLPKNKVIPGSGYLVVAEEKAGSAIVVPPGDIDKSPKDSERTPAQLLYNVIDDNDLPNLEAFLANGGVIDVVSPHPLVISEVMWGSDASIEDDHSKSQWIELYNAGAEYKTKEDDAATDANEATTLVFYGPNETPPAATQNADGTTTLPTGVTDRIGTVDAKGAYWSLAGKGQSGRTGTGEEAGQLAAVVPTLPIISMYRVIDADGKVADGQIASSWMQSTPPNVNFDPNKAGNRVGSPGAARLITAAEIAATAAAEKAKADAAAAAAVKAADTSVMMPKVGQIYISEIMVAGGGTLPQWIEISNGSRTEMVNLSGWTITVDNAAADADVSVGASIKFTVPEGTKIHPSGQNDYPSTLLVVTEAGRNNLTGAMAAGQVLNLWTENQTELILGGVTKRRYSLLSGMAFQITLAPPEPIAVPAKAAPAPTTAAEIAAARAAEAAKKAADAKAAAERKAATDVVGNLGTDGAATWALPMNEEGGRSSIIRRHIPVSIGPAEPEDGSMMDSWALASDTSFAQVTHIRAASYYGAANDVGTPGFRAGGALPVELSHFRPARQKETGAVVITWSTQSELNNAGFFIKRSQQKDGEFQVINAAMVPGAGTTSEKQFYTYTDTTAQPNVVYYYQIEDVSLDGNRQTLTRGIRLKGHVGAAGKLTTTWGDLKTQE